MYEAQGYSAKSVYEGLLKTFHQYLRAQYHIWDETLIAERDRLLSTLGVTHQEPRIESTPLYAEGLPYSKLNIPPAAAQILELASTSGKTGVPQVPYVHQAQAIEAFLKDRCELIVATGTGSGKTESFLMPIIGALAIEGATRPESWKKPGVRALLIYPMNALVNDQVARLRRLLGNAQVANQLQASRTHAATFGMYTSRTPYPGKRTPANDRDKVGAVFTRQFRDGITTEIKDRLIKEGKWPAKDIERFLTSAYQTANDDCELITRQEMQIRSPDLLVTNYSMLEYMMLRPIEASIFDQTRHWLEQDKENQLVVVLDEAHMYRGSAGAEVAYLLRRLHSRLGIPRDRVRYILTSASLGSDISAQKEIKEFAAKLTGADSATAKFELVRGTLKPQEKGRPATSLEQAALAAFDFDSLHHVEVEPQRVKEQLTRLFSDLLIERSTIEGRDPIALKDAAYDLLIKFPVAFELASTISSSPTPLSKLAEQLFTTAAGRSDAMEALLALTAFAKRRGSETPFAPIRSHLFFRGLPGLFACTNAACAHRLAEYGHGPLGRLYASPRVRCECGSRVYELLTHRTCGATYLRGYVKNAGGDFLWHEPTSGVWSAESLIEAHFYVVGDVKQDSSSGPVCWLHTSTGRLLSAEPQPSQMKAFIALIRPIRPLSERGRNVLTVESECPACKQGGPSGRRAMDLATKGEAPFAHLVRTQVSMQPWGNQPTPQSPNGGRKSLLFSDGRQKAARLARDIPREIELDVFRQVLMLASSQISQIGEQPRLNIRMYASFLKAVHDNDLQFFDGADWTKLKGDLEQFSNIYGNDLRDALDEFDRPPARYKVLLLKQLCSSFYSISALTIGYVAPSKTAMRLLRADLSSLLSDEEIVSLSVPWLQGLLLRFAFDPDIPPGVRREASPFPTDPSEARDGFTARQRMFLQARGLDVDRITTVLSKAMCERGADGGIYILPKQVMLSIAVQEAWFQCESCRTVLATCWWGACSNCQSPNVKSVNSGATSYLRARKGFWRDPVIGVIDGTERPMNLSVEEHTAQLSYKDVDSAGTTTEEFERRFRDILVDPKETSIDVLSCTTTMEVGIDIGSLIAVGMRNVPPMRQNYQQRAGRAGRRGSSISTVLTYAQNGAHDSYYFSQPDKIINGDPPRPILDTGNVRIATRHVHAQLVQDFFRPRAKAKASGDISSALGDTWAFFESKGLISLNSFIDWLNDSPESQASFNSASAWLPLNFPKTPQVVAREFVASLKQEAPKSEGDVEPNLIDFLFGKGLLPSYAFPRDLCALQIERVDPSARGPVVKIEERPQQSLNVALSEYAPGRLVVVKKKTYRVGTVAANGPTTEVDRAAALFDESQCYVHCEDCLFTSGFTASATSLASCPQCKSQSLRSVTVIRPEVAFPRGGQAIDELDDEQTFSQASGAQLPLQDSFKPIKSDPFGSYGELAFEPLQQLVLVNRGALDSTGRDGFDVCDRCGKVLLEGETQGSHSRDYNVQTFGRRPANCSGTYQHVYLGYSFRSDVLLLRCKMAAPIRFDFIDPRKRRPMEDALQSLSEALVLSMSRVLAIDAREVSAGFRFASQGGENFADVFVYDTLSGGAGYASEAGDRFEEIFEGAEKLLADCDCDASCEKCLRHYGNRFHHTNLNRGLALDLARYIRLGAIPKPVGAEQMHKYIAPLADMLAMAGWTVASTAGGSLRATSSAMSIEVTLCPSLIDCEPRAISNGVACYTFTPYEVMRDLAGAYSELA
jgi:ATP-dependent helicase YprA (DUF1998 family)/Zn finger protein HypA/HybF involved in hydrogenase expression